MPIRPELRPLRAVVERLTAVPRNGLILVRLPDGRLTQLDQ